MARLSLLAGVLAVSAIPASAGIFPSGAFSDRAAGTTSAGFLKSPPSARADALGEAFVASVEGAEAMFRNPAGMATLETSLESDVTMGYNALLETARLGSVGYARPVGTLGVFGAGLLYSSQGSQQGYNSVGDPTGKFTPTDLAFSMAYAKKLSFARLGGAFKVIRTQIADASGTTFALDAGAQWGGAVSTAEGPIDLAVAIQNLGPAMSVGSGSDPLPFRVQLGARWHLSERLSGVLDGFMTADQDPYAALGLEGRFPIGDKLAASLRGGYNIARTRGVDGLAGMSAGFGIVFNAFRLDYAWVPYGDLGTSNRITFGYSF